MITRKKAEIAKGTHPPCGILLSKDVMKMPSISIHGKKKTQMRRKFVSQITSITNVVKKVVMIMTQITTTPALMVDKSPKLFY